MDVTFKVLDGAIMLCGCWWSCYLIWDIMANEMEWDMGTMVTK